MTTQVKRISNIENKEVDSEIENLIQQLPHKDDLELKVNKSGDTMTGDLHTSGHFRPDKIWHAYGGFQGESAALSMSGWTKVTNAGGTLFVGLEADGFSLASDIITVVNAGDYVGHVSLTFIGSTTKDSI